MIWLAILNGAKAVLGFFLKPPGIYIAIALGCAVALWAYGQHEFNRGAKSVVQKQQAQTVRLVEHEAKITFNISMQFEAARLADQSNTQTLLQEIPIHVTPAIDLGCIVPIGFVRVFNAATHGPIPDASSGPDDASAGLTLSDIAKTDTENAGLYDQISHQLAALQDWVKQQAAAH